MNFGDLHGLNAIWLAEFGWYRVDARGGKPGIATRFAPPVEQLAFEPRLGRERFVRRDPA